MSPRIFGSVFSVKDRIAIGMLEDAESKGAVKPGETVIVDVTSGNTGIAWGMVAAARGYRTIQIIPEPYSIERRALMMAYGVEIVVTKKEDGIGGAIKKYLEVLKAQGDKGWSPRQFDNPANIATHYAHTGPEIWEQCGGKVDAIVAGYGTGGTISGVTTYLRGKNPDFKAYCVEPMEQSLLHGDEPGPHGIQGIVSGYSMTECTMSIDTCHDNLCYLYSNYHIFIYHRPHPSFQTMFVSNYSTRLSGVQPRMQ